MSSCNLKNQYDDDDIKRLAQKCGIRNADHSTREHLCGQIARSISSGTFNPDNSPECDEIKELAGKCGVSTSGSKEEMCQGIARSILSLPTTEYSEREYSPGEKKCVLKKDTVSDLVKNNTQNELVEMCKQKGMACSSYWTKQKLAETLIACAGPSKPNPVCLPKMDSLPSIEDLVQNYSKNDLREMCDLKKIKYTKSSTALELAKALDACTCPEDFDPEETFSDDESRTPDYTPPERSSRTASYFGTSSGGSSDKSSSVDRYRSELAKESAPRLKELVKELNLVGPPTTRDDIIEYLYSSKKNKRCVAPEWNCDGDLVCDISTKDYPNGEGVCIPEGLAKSRKNHASLTLDSGVKIVGMPSVIKKLQDDLARKRADITGPARAPTRSPPERPPPRPSERSPGGPFARLPPKPSLKSHLSKYDRPCIGDYTYDQLIKMDKEDLVNNFFGDPPKINPTLLNRNKQQILKLTKPEIVAYICSIGQKHHCKSPEWNQCEDDYVCDVSTDPGMCVRPDLADKQTSLKSKNYLNSLFNEKRVVGKKSRIDQINMDLSKSLETSRYRSPSPHARIEPAPRSVLSSARARTDSDSGSSSSSSYRALRDPDYSYVLSSARPRIEPAPRSSSPSARAHIEPAHRSSSPDDPAPRSTLSSARARKDPDSGSSSSSSYRVRKDPDYVLSSARPRTVLEREISPQRSREASVLDREIFPQRSRETSSQSSMVSSLPRFREAQVLDSSPGIPKRINGLDGTPLGDPPDTPESVESLSQISSGSGDSSDRKRRSRAPSPISLIDYRKQEIVGEDELLEELSKELKDPDTPEVLNIDPHTPTYDPPETPNVPPSTKSKKSVRQPYEDGTPVPVIQSEDVEDIITEVIELPKTKIQKANASRDGVTECLGLIGKKSK